MTCSLRLSVALGCAALVLLADVSHAGTNTWTIKGPEGGTFREVRASSTASNVYYAAYFRSLHRSTDGGVTWTTIRDFASQVNSIAVDPSNGDRLYVAVLDHGVFRSDDRGQSFVRVAPAGAGVWGVGTNGSTVYYSGDRKIYRSVDRGQSWSMQADPRQTLTKIVVDPQHGDVIYSFSGPFVIRSTDGVASDALETPINPGYDPANPTWIHDLVQLSPTHLIAACNDGLRYSTDSGATWTLASSGSFNSLAVDPSTPGRVVATSWNHSSLQLTTNYGADWSSFGATPTFRPEGVSFDASAASRMVVLGQQAALFTDNDAQTWTQATQSPIASSPSQLLTAPASNSKVYAYTVGGGSGLFESSNDGGWQRARLPFGGYEFGQARLALKPGAPDTIYFGSFAYGVYRTTDGGRSWTEPNSDLNGFAMQAFAFDPNDANIMYVNVSRATGTPAAGIYRSTDGGVTWSPHSTNLASTVSGTDMTVDPSDPARMFLSSYKDFNVVNSGGLHRSVDSGRTWNQWLAGESVYTVAVTPSNSRRVYAAASNGLQVSDDGGDTFSPNVAFANIVGASANAVVVDPVVPTTLYAATIDDAFGVNTSTWIMRSVDAGVTWEALRRPTDPGAWYVRQLLLDPNNPSLIYANTGARGIATLEIAPDLRLGISGHEGNRPQGGESTFNLRAVNHGPYAATAVKLSTQLPTGLSNVSFTADRGNCAASTCTVPVLGVGEGVNVVVRYTTPATALFLPIAASVTAHENDPIASDNTVQASAIAGEPGDLGVAITPSATSVAQGTNVTYSVAVTNRGATASNEGNVTFSLDSAFTLGALPGGCSTSGGAAACSLETIAPGASQLFTFTAVATNAGSAEATAKVALGPTLADINPADNTATSSVTATTLPPTSTSGGSGGGGSRGGGGAVNLAALLSGLLLLLLRSQHAFRFGRVSRDQIH